MWTLLISFVSFFSLSVMLTIKPLEDIAHESSPDSMTETARDEREPETSETNQTDPCLEPENVEKLEVQEQINENEKVDQLEELNNSEQDDENTQINQEMVLEAEDEQNIRSQSVQVLDDSVPVGCVSWREANEEEDLERSVRSDDPGFDSACSMLSFQIEVTEEILQKSAEIMSLTQTLSPTDTQETVRKIALRKTELVDTFLENKCLCTSCFSNQKTKQQQKTS